MASLENQPIDATYEGLLKTEDNAAITTVLKPLTDGDGNLLPVSVSTLGMTYTGIQDFTGATVTGAGGAAGLVAGTVADSIKSAATLTTIAAVATATNTIAIGNGADATQVKNICIGTGNAGSPNMIIIGDATGPSFSQNAIAIGNNMATDLAFRGDSISIGSNVYPSQFGVFIGNGAKHNLGGSVRCVAIGDNAQTGSEKGISLGANTNSTASNAVALGADITAATANTVTIKRLQMLDHASLNFVDDAAAATGGIPLGGVYHNAGALRIRIV